MELELGPDSIPLLSPEVTIELGPDGVVASADEHDYVFEGDDVRALAAVKRTTAGSRPIC
jgi:hypothetical protein